MKNSFVVAILALTIDLLLFVLILHINYLSYNLLFIRYALQYNKQFGIAKINIIYGGILLKTLAFPKPNLLKKSEDNGSENQTQDMNSNVPRKRKSKVLLTIEKNWQLYLLLLLPVVYMIIFEYGPIYGIQIAFKDYMVSKGIWGSPWVGLKHFKRFVNSPMMWPLIRNTVTISLYQLFASLPIPVILSILFKYMPFKRFAKTVQTVAYAPHFISTVVMVGIVLDVLSPRGGMLTTLLGLVGLGFETNLIGIPEAFSSIYVWSGIWQNMGFSTIIYTALLTGVDTNLHEAAMVDGASMLKRIWHIDLPCLIPQVILSLILGLGHVLNVGFEKAILLQNNMNLKYSEMISTYVYRMGIAASLPDVSYTTAIGFFKSIIAFILVMIVNRIARKFGEMSLW